MSSNQCFTASRGIHHPPPLRFTGTQYCQYARDNDGQNVSFSGTITRNAGSVTGTVVVGGDGILPLMQTQYHLVGGEGALTYQPQSPDASFVINMRTIGGWSDQLAGSASLDKTSANEATMANMHGDALTFVGNVVMKRNGNTYSSRGRVSDGYDATSWPDYQDCYVEIIDPNDSNGNGIPDLTDVVWTTPPCLAPQREDGKLKLKLIGGVGQPCTIQRPVDCREWQDWTNMTLLNTNVTLVDPEASQYPVRFYRAKP
ncbi:MAG: hypothetical protein M1608_00730 [Candidatus Omnitrophica bacterium]|nr:hypothetical protein [Candidatus Omnitrophota bacterium]